MNAGPYNDVMTFMRYVASPKINFGVNTNTAAGSKVSAPIKQAIMETMEKNSSKGKKKSYPKDIAKALSDNFGRSDVKKMIPELIAEDKLAYWSSGSTTYIMLKKDFDELSEKESHQ